jgi:hypothetical protein
MIVAAHVVASLLYTTCRADYFGNRSHRLPCTAAVKLAVQAVLTGSHMTIIVIRVPYDR